METVYVIGVYAWHPTYGVMHVATPEETNAEWERQRSASVRAYIGEEITRLVEALDSQPRVPVIDAPADGIYQAGQTVFVGGVDTGAVIDPVLPAGVGIYDPRCPAGQHDPGPPHPSQTTTPDPSVHTGTRPAPMSTHPYHNPGAAQQAGAAQAKEAGKELPYNYEHYGLCSLCGDSTYCARGYSPYEYLCSECDRKLRGVR